MTGRVYVVQVPARRSGPRGDWEEKYDLSPAEEFGEVIKVLGYGNVPEDPMSSWPRFREILTGFDPDRDYVLLLGDPVACARAVWFLCRLLDCRSFKALKWDRREGRYRPYDVG